MNLTRNRGRILNLKSFIVAVCFMLALLVACNIYHIKLPEEKGVFHFDMVEIGGIKQAVMIQGKHKDNPVLVFLHGGPGFPLFPLDQLRETTKYLEEHYTIAYWEQRGTGKSLNRNIKPKSMTVSQFVEDTKQVIEHVKGLTGAEKVFIWGHSWGSNIGALFAAQYPEYLHAYISTGQSVNPFMNERLCYEYVLYKAEKNNNRRALRQLSKIDTVPDNYSLEDALLVRKWVYRYGGVVKKADEDKSYINIDEVLVTLTASEYSIADRFNMVIRPYYSAEKLWEELKSINLKEQAPQIDVPVYFLVGRYDIIVSHVLAEKYFNVLKAPKGKQLIWFENTAHRPHVEEKEKFIEIMNNKILNEVLN